jgi:hypothetical protein
MKRGDKHLEGDEEIEFSEIWQIVKESVPQTKQDNKRNNIIKALRTSNINITSTSLLQVDDNHSTMDTIICY